MALTVPSWLLVLGGLAAVAALAYLAYREFRADYQTGEYHFTWGVGVVTLFLLGFVPGLVGLGLYLTVERDYPIHWLFAAAVASVLLVAVVGFGVETVTVASFVGGP